MKKLVLVITALLCTGCATSLSGGWQDFRAYYNSYYNAADRFNRGMEALGDRGFSVPEQGLVRIHPSRHLEGQPDFQATIEKTSSILQKFPQSRWADDALYLKARSHYHRKELFKAYQDFEELYRRSRDSNLRNEAVLWKSRVMYDLERHEDAVTWLEGHLAELEVTPDRNFRAEAKALLAEHHVQTGRLDRAHRMLGEASSELPVGDIRSRTHFMYGQVLEQMGAWREAYFAYANVAQGYPDHAYIFWSELSKARMARLTGRQEEAIELLGALLRDDKNYGYIDLITLEIGRTLEMQGRTAEAEQVYGDLLHASRQPPEADIRSGAYYRLGIIHSEQYRNYPVAAAYFDSASSGNVALSAGPGDMNRLAASYRRYSELREQIGHSDSLLWLGSLSEQELDSVLEAERERRMEELKIEQDRRSDLLYNAMGGTGNAEDNRSSTLFGFLNYRNEGMAEASVSRFRAWWGERPRMDNWRRTEAVRNTRTSAGEDAIDTEPVTISAGAVDLDLDAIPVTRADRAELHRTLAASHIELGNLFLLSLQMPDSAARYYRKVIRDYPESDLAPRAQWSLYELFRSEGPADSADAARRRLLAYDRSDLEPDLRRMLYPDDSLEAERSLRESYEAILGDTAASTGSRAERLKRLSLEQGAHEEAAALFYRAVELQIAAAKDSGDSGRRDAAWDSVRSALEELRTRFPDAPEARKAALLQEELRNNPVGTSPDAYRTCEEADRRLTVRGGAEAFMEKVTLPESVAGMQLQGEISYRFRVDETGAVESWELISPATGLGIEDALEARFAEELQFNPIRVEGQPAAVECGYSFSIDPP